MKSQALNQLSRGKLRIEDGELFGEFLRSNTELEGVPREESLSVLENFKTVVGHSSKRGSALAVAFERGSEEEP